MIIVLISGHQGAGKTTLAKNLLRENLGSGVYALRFAQPLYEMHDACRQVLANYSYSGYDFSKKDGPLLQVLGTEWGRKLDPNIWANMLLNKISRLPTNSIVTIEDCRFRNEFDAFEGRTDVLRVRLEASKETRKQRAEMWRENDQHQSEIDLDGYADEGKFDLYLDADALNSVEILNMVQERINKMKEI
jgi:phosphomevalonate kinase